MLLIGNYLQIRQKQHLQADVQEKSGVFHPIQLFLMFSKCALCSAGERDLAKYWTFLGKSTIFPELPVELTTHN